MDSTALGSVFSSDVGVVFHWVDGSVHVAVVLIFDFYSKMLLLYHGVFDEVDDRCEFFPEVRCFRVGVRVVKCRGCFYLKKFEEEMEAEEEEFFDEVEAMRRRGF